MKSFSIHIGLALLLILLSQFLFAQEKTQSYYNRHEDEIIPDATFEFAKGNYERTIELCRWHYIIVGDDAANSLRETAERCTRLTNEITLLKSEVEDKIKNARVLALTLLSINPGDTSIKDFLQWSERALSDTLSSRFVGPLMIPDSEPSMEMVDLGLSVKWATCNLGASKPEEIGSFYAWGETSPRTGDNGDTIDWNSYQWCKGSYNSLTRYCTISDFGYNGFVDRLFTVELEDDSAHKERGGKWRMPTEKEILELVKKCVWNWTQLSGVDGYMVTSKINGKSIFLPVPNSQSRYWTSSLSDGRPYSAKALELRPNSINTSLFARSYGFAIRPVFSK